MNIQKALVLAAFSLVAMPMLLSGCQSKDDGLTNEQRQTKDRFSEIMERSKGDWNQLTDEDKKFLVNDLSNGNEQAAKTMFEIRASRGKSVPPGMSGPGPK